MVLLADGEKGVFETPLVKVTELGELGKGLGDSHHTDHASGKGHHARDNGIN